ncbi:hypothetical protein PVNG_03097 [Plasmodium vivax North Korean]|uniref:VIR protein n=1 Tax=Plasmodium vivax North Korean TaxID=1035514 RepID=A0A0J9TZ21_PLAVI|nr:hypothetical protein PVNG_03097 [Plasmodium vivax North Korean]
MAIDDKIYTVNDFAPHTYIKNNELDDTNLIRLYKSFFQEECNKHYGYNFYCDTDGSEKKLPSTLWELYKKFERNVKLIQEKTEIFSVWEKEKKKLSKCPRCECEFNISSFYHIKQLKRAYDYFLFLNAYKDTRTISKHIADKNYCTYIENTKYIYSSLEYICKDNLAPYCKEFIDNELPPIKEDDNSSISCNASITVDTDLEKGSQGFKGPHHKLHPGRIEEQGPNVDVEGTTGRTDTVQEVAGAKLGSAPEKEPERTLGSNPEEELSSHGPILQPQKEDVGPHPYFSGGLPDGEGDKVTPHLGISSDGNGSPIKTITSASMVGIPSIIFLLYKFTPIRTWIDPRIRKTKDVLRNGVNESNELQSNDYNFDHADMDINRYNIAYQSR